VFFRSQRRRSGGDVEIVGESAEDSFAMDPVLDEVDQFGWLGVGLGRCELAEGTVWPGAVVVPQVSANNSRR
jgi:hypothetical protein